MKLSEGQLSCDLLYSVAYSVFCSSSSAGPGNGFCTFNGKHGTIWFICSMPRVPWRSPVYRYESRQRTSSSMLEDLDTCRSHGRDGPERSGTLTSSLPVADFPSLLYFSHALRDTTRAASNRGRLTWFLGIGCWTLPPSLWVPDFHSRTQVSLALQDKAAMGGAQNG